MSFKAKATSQNQSSVSQCDMPILLIAIKHLYSATWVRGDPDSGQCLHWQIVSLSGACETDQMTLAKAL